jgi:hypothetical protein
MVHLQAGVSPLVAYNGADGKPLAASTKLEHLDGDALHNGSTVVVTRLPAEQVMERLGLYQSVSKWKKKK